MINGRISIDLSFEDRTSSGAVAALKMLALREGSEYTTGKVAIESGTVGTTVQFLAYGDYRDSGGNLQNLTPLRFAFRATPGARIVNDFGHELSESRDNICIDNWRDQVAIKTTAGTATYTLLVYGT